MVAKEKFLFSNLENIKFVFISFCFSMLVIYTVAIRDKISNLMDFNRIFFDNTYQSKSYVDYDDLFLSIEADIQKNAGAQPARDILGDADYQAQHEHIDDHAEEISHLGIREIIEKKNEEAFQNMTTHRDELIKKYGLAPDSTKSEYLLPIQDAFTRNMQTVETTQKEIVKEDIANLYEKRAEMTLLSRKVKFELAKDIRKLNSIYKSLDITVPQKFLTLPADISPSKILKKLGMSSEELAWRYPDIKEKLQEIYRLRVFSSFLPIHKPVLKARRSSSFGYRTDPFTKKRRLHSGLDYAAPKGTRLIASGVGIIKYAGRRGGYGNTVEIYHGNGLMTRYAHLSKISVKKGDRISKGEKIGEVGSTGRSTGAHLHYEIRIDGRAVNPHYYLASSKKVYDILNKY